MDNVISYEVFLAHMFKKRFAKEAQTKENFYLFAMTMMVTAPFRVKFDINELPVKPKKPRKPRSTTKQDPDCLK